MMRKLKSRRHLFAQDRRGERDHQIDAREHEKRQNLFSIAEIFEITPPIKPNGKLIRQSRRISPSSGFSRPAIILINVVLPVPFGAKIPIERPNSTRKLTFSRMTLRCVPVQKDLLTLLNSSTRPSENCSGALFD